PRSRASVQAVSELPIDTPAGSVVRLGDVAKVTVGPVPNAIERENDSRRLDVAANVRHRDLGSVVTDVKYVSLTMELPRGSHAALLGYHQERQASQGHHYRIAIIDGLAILLLLQVSFGR